MATHWWHVLLIRIQLSLSLYPPSNVSLNRLLVVLQSPLLVFHQKIVVQRVGPTSLIRSKLVFKLSSVTDDNFMRSENTETS